MKKTTLLLTLFISIGLAVNIYSSPPKIQHLYYHSWKPISDLKANSPSKIQFSFQKNFSGCGDKLNISIGTHYGLQILSPTSLVADFATDSIFSTIIDIVIPDNEQSILEIIVYCDSNKNYFRRYFIPNEDGVEDLYHPSHSKYYVSPYEKQKKRKPELEDFTEEELDKEYEINILFPDSATILKFEEITNIKAIPDNQVGFTTKVSLRVLFKLFEEDIEIGLIGEAPWPKSWPPRTKKPVDSKQKGSKPQGSLDGFKSQSYVSGFSLESVDNIMVSGDLPIDKEITFNLRLNNTTAQDWLAVTNGFRVYSPDGADWGSVRADTSNSGWRNMFDFWYTINYYSNTGVGADTVGFSGFSMFSDGLSSNFNDVAYQITIGPFDESDIGKTVCLDSSFFRASGVWQWNSDPDYYYPEWDGPHCYTIRGDSIFFSGYLFYQDPVPSPDTSLMPVRNAVIELWDEDFGLDDLKFSTTTEDDGYFELGPVENYEYVVGSTKLDIYLKTYAENDAVYVTDSYNGNIFDYKTETEDELPSGEYDTIVEIPLDRNGPFCIADIGLDARESAISLGFFPYPQKFQYVSKGDSSGSRYLGSYIHIEAAFDSTQGFPDTYDKGTILHEYGHKLEGEYDFFDGGGGTHYWYGRYTQELAASEGFSHFFAAHTLSSNTYQNYWNDFTDVYEVNVENGEYNTNTHYWGSANAMGDSCEASVAGMLWDIYDNVNDDYSERANWLTTTLPHSPDGIMDSLSNGYANIIDVLLNRTINGHRPDNIEEFFEAWYQVPSKNHEHAITDIRFEHGEGCCIGFTGNADNDPDDLCDIGDINYLVEYQFNNGPRPVCMDEADVDGDGLCDIADINYLVDWQFGDPPGPPPISCP